MQPQNNRLCANEHSVQRQKETEALKGDAWKKNRGTVLLQTSLPVLQGGRSGVKPAWLSLCFLSRPSELWQGFSSPEVMMASFFGRDLE